MADILKFAGFGRREPAAAAPAATLSCDTLPMGAQGVSAFGAEPHATLAYGALAGRDWNNQELADLYRVEALLVQANIRIETTRGVTDEGDPWFVFCHADGEVFVHLARIDGLYILDGPGLDSVLRGESFAALIDRFASAVAARAATGNIVQFRPGKTDSVVRLHPAVMLAALVWSLYLASDHFVGTAHAEETDGSGDGHAALFPSLAPLHDEPAAETTAETVHEQADKALVRLDAEVGRKGPADDIHRLVAREAELSRAGATADGAGSYWSMTSGATGIAAGLTAIAISFGLYDSKFAERAHNAAKLAAAEASSPGPDTVHAALAQQDFAPADKAVAESKDALAAREVAAKVEPVNVTLQAAEHVREAAVHLDAEVKIEEAVQTAAAGKASSLPGPIEKAVVAMQAEASPSQGTTLTKMAASDDGQDLQSLVTLATQHLGQVSTYKLAGISVDATFDVSTLNKQTAQLVLADLSGQSGSTVTTPIGGAGPQPDGVPHADIIAQYLPYDTAAKSFVYQFLLKSHSIEMIKSDNMVVFVDTTAVDDPNDHAYSVSWVSDDHFIVSTIGHAQDFAGYGLA